MKKKLRLWNFIDKLEGDKVIWMIVLLLILISIVTIFSSTSLLALRQENSRINIISGQLVIAVGGILCICFCYIIKNIGIFKFFSQLGFFVSFVLLLILTSHLNLGFIKAVKFNDSWRALQVFGKQIHIYEIVKVAMVMYLCWAVDSYKKDSFSIINLISKHSKFSFLAKPIWKRTIYIFIPMFTISILVLSGGVSSAIIVFSIMVITILLGGIGFKDLAITGLVAIITIFFCIKLYQYSDGKIFNRIGTVHSRLSKRTSEYIHIAKTANRSSETYSMAIEKIMQPQSAKIAIKEGKFMGKGPGKSTQRYIVPVMYEDFMFSFIVEEYGLLGAILVLGLYIGLLARASIIVRNCSNEFAQNVVGALAILISGQAIFHILINLDLGILTGQTLPMISHGNSSFISFSIAFGIIISISRMAYLKIAKEAADAAPLLERKENVISSLDELEELEKMNDEF